MSNQLITGDVVHFCDSAMQLLWLQRCINKVERFIWPLLLDSALRQTTLHFLAHFEPKRNDRFQNQTYDIVEA